MLDRKIKDIDASVELLTDRIKLSKPMAGWLYIFSIAFIALAGGFYCITWTVGIPMFFLCAAMISMGGFYTVMIIVNNMGLLLYFKKQEDKNNVKGEKDEQKIK